MTLAPSSRARSQTGKVRGSSSHEVGFALIANRRTAFMPRSRIQWVRVSTASSASASIAHALVKRSGYFAALSAA